MNKQPEFFKGKKCEVCGSKKDLSYHGDNKILCRSCHIKEHRIENIPLPIINFIYGYSGKVIRCKEFKKYYLFLIMPDLSMVNYYGKQLKKYCHKNPNVIKLKLPSKYIFRLENGVDMSFISLCDIDGKIDDKIKKHLDKLLTTKRSKTSLKRIVKILKGGLE